jgi:hypothetical protein
MLRAEDGGVAGEDGAPGEELFFLTSIVAVHTGGLVSGWWFVCTKWELV